MWEHYKRTYASDTLVVAAAGAVDHDEVCGRVLADLAAAGWDASPDAVPRERRFEVEPFAPLDVHDITVPRESEQSHLYLTCQGIAVRDERRWAMSVLTTILGGGMSSRLFQEVREKRGLAYTTYAFDTSYAGAGAFGLYAGCAPGDVDEVCAVMIGEFEKLAEHGVTEREMMRARGQLRGAMVLGERTPWRVWVAWDGPRSSPGACAPWGRICAAWRPSPLRRSGRWPPGWWSRSAPASSWVRLADSCRQPMGLMARSSNTAGARRGAECPNR